MKKYFIFFVFIFVLNPVFGQQPELFIDFNEGETNSFASSESAYIGSDIVMTVIGVEIGEEPAIISNGTFMVLKDINAGELDSDPTGYISYNGHVYFTAKDEENGYAVWKTDGTSEGTVIDFNLEDEPTARPRSYIIAADGGLYYNYGNLIYRTDGTEHKLVYTGGFLIYNYANASYAYSTYKDGIAFMRKNNDDTFTLIYVNENESVELAITEDAGFFGAAIGVAELDGGLMFSLDDSDFDGIYVYNEADESLSLLAVGGETLTSRRTVNFTKTKNISWIGGKGYYIINGVEGEEVPLLETSNNAAVQGDKLQFAKYDEKIAFIADESLFGDYFIIHTDGTIAGSSTLLEIQSYYSDMITYGKYGIIADGTSNGFDPKIRLIDIEEGTAETIFEDTNGSIVTNSLRPVGVQNEYLYYIYRLNPSVGAELFRIKIDGLISTKEVDFVNLEFDIMQQGDDITIKFEETKQIDVSLFNLVGQVIYVGSLMSNTPFTIPTVSGSYWINVSDGTKQGTRQISLF